MSRSTREQRAGNARAAFVRPRSNITRVHLPSSRLLSVQIHFAKLRNRPRKERIRWTAPSRTRARCKLLRRFTLRQLGEQARDDAAYPIRDRRFIVAALAVEAAAGDVTRLQDRSRSFRIEINRVGFRSRRDRAARKCQSTRT